MGNEEAANLLEYQNNTIENAEGFSKRIQMSTLNQRLLSGEVILLDGAVGMELQQIGIPMDSEAWCAAAILSHPDVIRDIHAQYINLGVDVIITNTFSSARYALEAAKLGEETVKINTKAVELAQQARDTNSAGKPVFIAGSISTFRLVGDGFTNFPMSETEAFAHFSEQAQVLAEAGVDLLVLEMMMDTTFAPICVEAAAMTGLPVWIGFSTAANTDRTEIKLRAGKEGSSFCEDLTVFTTLGFDAATIMHTTPDITDLSLPILKKHWQGPFGAYPHARDNFTISDRDLGNILQPDQVAKLATRWISEGAQIIGTCCGFGPPYIRAIEEKLMH